MPIAVNGSVHVIEVAANTYTITTATAGPQGPAGISYLPATFLLAQGVPATTGVNVTGALVVPVAGRLTSCFIYAKTPPTGAAFVCDILINGVSIWHATPSNRIQLSAGVSSGTQTTFDTTSVNVGDVLTINIVQVGSETAGKDITVELLFIV